MRRILKLEIRRAIRSKWTLISFMIVFVICLGLFAEETIDLIKLGYFEDEKISAILSIYDRWIFFAQRPISVLLMFILPIMVVLPYGDSYYTDMKSGYIKQIVTRVSKRKYYLAKYIATYITGGMVVVLPIIIQIMLYMLIYPVSKPYLTNDAAWFSNGSPGVSMYYEHPFVFLLIWMMIYFIVFGAMAVLALFVSQFIYNYFSIILTPFVVSFVLIVIANITENGVISFWQSLWGRTVSGWNYMIPVSEVANMILLSFVSFVCIKKEVI